MDQLFSTEGFPPRWRCGDWSDLHGWVHVCADVAIFGAYSAIPAVLAWFVSRRRDVPFPPIFWLFGAFILACGMTHLIDATLFWHPWYRLSAAVKVLTAVVSWATVLCLVRVLPRALEMPGLANINARLLREIEERRRAEASHRAIEERYGRLVESIHDYGIFMLDREGRIESWNHGAEELNGYRENEIVGSNHGCLFCPEDVAAGKPRAILKQAASEGRAEMESWSLRKDGSRFWADILATPVLGEGRELRGFSVVVRDLTDRRLLEERLRMVVEAAPSAMLMVDAEGRMTLVNSQTEKLFGYPREELLGRPVEMLIPPRFRGAHPGHRAHFFANPAVRAMGAGRDLFAIRKDGSEVSVEIGLNPVQTDEGSFVLASIIDITERKRVEDQRQKALEESMVLLKEVHHRVKNNMQVVSSLLSLHAGRLRDAAQTGVFADCRERIRAMALIHERLYTTGRFARLEFGGYLAEMARMILGSSSRPSGGARLDLQLEPVEINLDSAVPLGLIASELVLNALKHGIHHDRGTTLTIRLRSGPDSNELVVQDDGPGLPEGFAPERSTGIGIELVENLVRQIRGECRYQAVPKGTRVSITWPLQRPAADEPAMVFKEGTPPGPDGPARPCPHAS